MDAERILTQLGRTLLDALGNKLEDGQPIMSVESSTMGLGLVAGPLTLSNRHARSLYQEDHGTHHFSLRDRKGSLRGYYGWDPRPDGRLPHLLYVEDHDACFPIKELWVEARSGNIISVTDPALVNGQPLTMALLEFL